MKAQYENHYLSDRDVANFARQSFAKLADNFTEAQNNKLIQFLARGMASGDWETLITEMLCLNTSSKDTEEALAKARTMATYLRSIPCHWVPFGHPQITLRMQAPIPIRVQCFKHKIGFVESEESRRYISTKPEVYVPEYLREKATNAKQGSGNKHSHSDYWKGQYVLVTGQAVKLYESMVFNGVCPEQARFVLPQGCEVNWVWTGSLYAYANFYNQRSNSHAQKEIQDLAAEVNKIIAPLYPISWAALTRGDY